MKKNTFDRMEKDEIRNTKIRIGLFSKMLRYMKPYILHMTISLLLLLVLTAVELYMPLITKQAVDNHIVTNKKVIAFDNKKEFDEFDIDKFVKYQFQEKYFVVYPLQKQKLLKKEIVRTLKNEKKLLAETYITIELTDENSEILLSSDVMRISETTVIASDKQLDKFSKKELV
ncbi:MAG: hypothetical protein U9N34_02920, partial [Candidatus Cloacimonadota bacterium]|nr:hypothetical protein [Candidatus Cloacimonadota bacterium]